MTPFPLPTLFLKEEVDLLATTTKDRRWLWWLALLLLAIPGLWPLLAEGLPRSFDGGLHMLRVGLLDYHLRHGVIFPRWTPELLLGYGYPLFTFYAPVSYYLVEFLHLTGLSIYWAFTLTCSLVVLGAGLGMWQWADDLFGREQRWATLLTATAYMYTPYLYMNIYTSGALPAASAQALLPWIFWSTWRLLHTPTPRLYLVPVVVSVSGLALTHNITTVFLAPVLAGYLLLHWLPNRHDWRRTGWVALTLLAAVGLSLFFWLPVLFERQYLADSVQEISKTAWLPGSFWTWENFLNWNFFYQYTFARPIPLGLIQLLLALVGVVLVRRARWVSNWEWHYWLAVALLLNSLIGHWALPLWLNNEVLSVTQFAWRLLSLSSLPLALFTGGLLLHLQRRWLVVLAALALLTLIIVAQRPQLAWMDLFSEPETAITQPVFAQIEVEKGILGGGEGNSSIQEFRPRWVDRTLVLDAASASAPGDSPPAVQVQIQQAGAYQMQLRYTSQRDTILRFTTFYFPGWQVQVDGQTLLTPYPDTNLGLLTVAIPAGSHALQIAWRGTALQFWSNLLSLLTIALLVWHTWRPGIPVWQRFWINGLFVFVLTAYCLPQPQSPLLEPVTQPVRTEEFQLLGYRIEETATAGELYVHAYWYVTQTPDADVQVHWQLQDETGKLVADMSARPYFNTLPANTWPPNTVVDDVYQLVLPPETAAATYQLAVAIVQPSPQPPQPLTVIGAYRLGSPTPPQRAPAIPLDVQLGDAIRLTGYDLTARGAFPSKPTAPLLIVNSGEYLTYRLYWQALAPVTQNYHGFVHLIAGDGHVVAQEDHLPGPLFHPPLLWQSSSPQTDAYLLRLPPDLVSGLYWPQVGLYEFATLERLPVYTRADPATGDHYRLPPVKVINRQTRRPAHAFDARFADMATLIGYDLQLPPAGLHRGEDVTLHLYYRSHAATDKDYVRFLQLYQPALGMAAQADSPPQEGANPTWSWLPGETIVDPVTLRIAADAKPGRYSLYTGFYQREDGSRVSVYDASGAGVADNWIKLTELDVLP